MFTAVWPARALLPGEFPRTTCSREPKNGRLGSQSGAEGLLPPVDELGLMISADLA